MNHDAYSWNPAFRYIIGIKHAYLRRFEKLDTFSIEEMAKRLHTKEYNNFLRCVDIHVNGTLNGFKYSLIKGGDSDIYRNPDSVLREMRGLVIDVEREEIVVCPFRKFFNINEIPETSLDEVSKKIQNANLVELTNKLDGSMVSARFYYGEIFLSGTGCIDARISFRLQEAASWMTDKHQRMLKEHPDETFLFEYISWQDKHVVEYPKDKQNIYLIPQYVGKGLPFIFLRILFFLQHMMRFLQHGNFFPLRKVHADDLFCQPYHVFFLAVTICASSKLILQIFQQNFQVLMLHPPQESFQLCCQFQIIVSSFWILG